MVLKSSAQLRAAEREDKVGKVQIFGEMGFIAFEKDQN